MIKNSLENEPIVFDIIAEYKATLEKLNQVDSMLKEYKSSTLVNKEIEDTYRNIVKGPPEKQDDTLKDDESLGF